jgi:hypothetical protein
MFEDLMDGVFDDDEDVFPAKGLRRVGGFCHTLFEDPYLVACLRAKTHWGFVSLESFVAVQSSIPSFPESTSAVYLNLIGTDAVIPRLSVCTNLVQLGITGDFDKSFDLSAIGIHLPHLKILSIERCHSVCGSLVAIKCLEEFELLQPFFIEADEYERWIFIFCPISSGETLNRLTLVDCVMDDVYHFFRHFTNLKHLKTEVAPVGESLEKHLLDISSARLVSLETDLHFQNDTHFELDLHIHFISSPCLANLTTISLRLFYTGGHLLGDDDLRGDGLKSFYIGMCMEVLERMAEVLSHVEEIELFAGIDLAQAHHLSRFKTLKCLDWAVPLGFVGGKDERDLTSRVLGLFEGFVVKPDISVCEEMRKITDGDYYFDPGEIEALLGINVDTID